MPLGLGPVDATRGVDTATALSGPEASLKDPPDMALPPGWTGLDTRGMLPDVRDAEQQQQLSMSPCRSCPFPKEIKMNTAAY